jgi:hypothetical protein
MKEIMNRDIPYFVDLENEELLTKWEMDRYLVDRRKIIQKILSQPQSFDILKLTSDLNVTDNNLARTINELIDLAILKEINRRTFKFTKNAKAIIFSKRSDFFRPKLFRTWNTVPQELKQ